MENVVIGREVKVDKEVEWWIVMISCEKNIIREVIFWNRFYRLQVEREREWWYIYFKIIKIK